VFAYDSAYPDVNDNDGFRREAERARSLGYLGKNSVRPRQIAIANEIFSVAELDLATARRIAAAADDAAEQGRGVFLLDGRIIDLHHLKRARALVAEANESSDRN
jgi:citrate lyase subunit beta/citryl-CoA lyase